MIFSSEVPVACDWTIVSRSLIASANSSIDADSSVVLFINSSISGAFDTG